jgi:hypothetical protein
MALTVGLLKSQGIAGQSKGESIQGVWRTVEVTMTGPAARTISQIQPNLTILTARHYSRIHIDRRATSDVGGRDEGKRRRAAAV